MTEIETLLSLLQGSARRDTASEIAARRSMATPFIATEVALRKVPTIDKTATQVAVRVQYAQEDCAFNAKSVLLFPEQPGVTAAFIDELASFAQKDEAGNPVFDKDGVCRVDLAKLWQEATAATKSLLRFADAKIVAYRFPKGPSYVMRDGKPMLVKATGKPVVKTSVDVLAVIASYDVDDSGVVVPRYAVGFDPVTQGQRLEQRYYYTAVAEPTTVPPAQAGGTTGDGDKTPPAQAGGTAGSGETPPAQAGGTTVPPATPF